MVEFDRIGVPGNVFCSLVMQEITVPNDHQQARRPISPEDKRSMIYLVAQACTT